MSAHRDLMNAQQTLNEAVAEFVQAWRDPSAPSLEAQIEQAYRWYDSRRAICVAFDAFDTLRQDLSAPGGSAPRHTSINAGHVNLANKESLRRNVVFAVVANQTHFHTGMTVAELKGRLRKEHSSVSSAISELVKRGWLKDSGTTRLTQHGQPAIVWAPTDLAVSKCRETALEVADER